LKKKESESEPDIEIEMETNSNTLCFCNGQLMDNNKSINSFVPKGMKQITILANFNVVKKQKSSKRSYELAIELPEPLINPLISMGFSKNSVTRALLMHALDLNRSLDWLLNNSGTEEAETPLTREEVSAFLGIRPNFDSKSGDFINFPSILELLIKNHICTYTLTGTNYQNQTYYRCYTCSSKQNQGCCEACKDICHAGHSLSEPIHGNFYCDCGAGELGAPCKCLGNRKAFRNINMNIPKSEEPSSEESSSDESE